MKKTITFLSWMFIVMLTSVSFVSCGDDDDDKNGNTLVGVWKAVWDEDGSYSLYTFKSDGTGVMFEMDYADGSYSENFTYVYDAPNLTIFWIEEGYSETCKISFLSKDIFTSDLIDDGDIAWTRQ